MEFKAKDIAALLKGMTAGVGAVIMSVVYDMGKNVARAKEALGLFTAAAVVLAAFVFNTNAILLIVVSLAVYALIFNFKEKLRK